MNNNRNTRDELLKRYEAIRADFVEEYISDAVESVGRREALVLDIYGVGGMGKTWLLQEMSNKNVANQENFYNIYVDISGYHNYVSVLKEIRDTMIIEVEKNRNNALQGDAFVKFDIIYEVFYGEDGHRKSQQITNYILDELKNTQDDIENKAAKFVKGVAKDVIVGLPYLLIEFVEAQKSGNIVHMKLVGLKYGLEKIVAATTKGVKAFGGNSKEIKEVIGILLEDLKQLKSLYDIDDYLLKSFTIEAKSIFQDNPFAVFIDNFRYDAKNISFNRNHMWLTGEKGLLREMPALWIIGGRDSLRGFLEHFIEAGRYESMNIQGVTYEEITKYYKKTCGICGEENELSELEERMIVAAAVDRMKEGNGTSDLKEILYLPMRMRLIADYYNSIKKEKEDVDEGVKVHVSDLARLEKLTELCYYFEINLSELKLDVFYILSCIEVWNENWFKVIKERFDNYLLNARVVLTSSSSVERLAKNRIKLHDLIREELYGSTNNLIKYDIQEWVFVYFLHKQGVRNTILDIEFVSPSNGLSDVEELQVYVPMAFKYIETLKEGQGKGSKEHYTNSGLTPMEAFELFLEGFGKSFDLYNSPETVNTEIVNIVEEITEWCMKHLPASDSLGRCHHWLGFLYTNTARNNLSLIVDREAWEIQEEAIKNLPKEKTFDNYIIPMTKLNACKNSCSYDYGHAQWYYEKAAKLSTEVIKNQLDIMKEAAKHLVFTEEQMRAYSELMKFLSGQLSGDYREYVYGGSSIEKKLSEEIELLKGDRDFERLMMSEDKQNGVLLVYAKACGNYPWFGLRLLENEAVYKKYYNEVDLLMFGVKTYLFRKMIWGESLFACRSLHNVCVYLFKYGRTEEALELDELTLGKIDKITFKKYTHDKVIQNFGDKLKELKGLGLFRDDEVDNNVERNYECFDYDDLGIEVIQYISNYHLDIANRCDEEQERIYHLNCAIEKGLMASIIRFANFALKKDKVYETLSYAASYYYALGEKGRAEKIIKYVVGEIENTEGILPERKKAEYNAMLWEMTNGTWEEGKRL